MVNWLRLAIKRVLVIDDETDMSNIIKLTLEMEGLDVEVFNDPSLALEKYKSNYYNLLIIDVKMPGLDGFELYRRIKEMDRTAKACFLTGYDPEYLKKDIRYKKIISDIKSPCYILKPILVDDLQKVIRQKIDRNDNEN